MSSINAKIFYAKHIFFCIKYIFMLLKVIERVYKKIFMFDI